MIRKNKNKQVSKNISKIPKNQNKKNVSNQKKQNRSTHIIDRSTPVNHKLKIVAAESTPVQHRFTQICHSGVDTVHLCVDTSSLSQKPVLKQ
ncbi:hypothetical protein Taro_016725 [Colocasia esculenta]|uniref:Uncharacterized protein n=1 Tax=Colocasia esculenta TaxID=4460 RepID=A0A843UX69_COLES|nr:hypothetical protein [Colocasia esculenta]